MSMSLRDQLLQAGLVNQKKARETERQLQKQQRERQQLPKEKRAAPSDAELASQRAQLAKTARDQELSRQQKEQADKRARHAQIEQLIKQNCLPRPLCPAWMTTGWPCGERGTVNGPRERNQRP